MTEPKDVTQLLAAAREGDESARGEILTRLYDELRALAASHMRREKAGHTLQATALVNEAYLRLAGADVQANDRAHLIALAAQSMRRVLVDHARSKQREKRGGDLAQVTLNEEIFSSPADDAALLELHDALERLAIFDERSAKAVELMYFGGLTYAQTGEVLGIARTTLFEDLRFAKAWLARELAGDNPSRDDST